MKSQEFLPVFEKSNHLHPPTYYYLKTGYIPSIITFFRIDIQQLLERLSIEFKLTEKEIIKTESHNIFLTRPKLTTAYIELPNSILICLFHQQAYVELYHCPQTPPTQIERVQSIIFECLRKVSDEKKVGLIVSDSGGALDVREFSISNQECVISEMYNDDFADFNSQLLEKIENKKSAGLILLHGAPGTGKSSYIRYLIGAVKKNFIYLPSSMAHHIAQPSFLHFLSKHSGAVIILEDSEELLMKRKSESKPAISNLLNLSDGLLADCLKTQIIATFNCDYNKIDDAFLRKGRVIGRYCFDPLTVQKSNMLLKKMEFNFVTTKPMTLAEIFNHHDEDYSITTKRTPLGFSVTHPSN